MDDLISRSVLINKIRGIVPSSQDVDFIVRLIENQPTAYNVDAVVEQLEKAESVKNFGSVNSGNILIPLKDAIEIVRKGGVQ